MQVLIWLLYFIPQRGAGQEKMNSSEWKKAVGIGLGYCVAGPVGALLGFIIGRSIEKPDKIEEDASLRACYKALQVTPTATPGEIKRAYRSLVKQYHPDLQGHLDEKGADAMKRKVVSLNEAYRTIRTVRGF